MATQKVTTHRCRVVRRDRSVTSDAHGKHDKEVRRTGVKARYRQCARRKTSADSLMPARVRLGVSRMAKHTSSERSDGKTDGRESLLTKY